jgi:hypothetical protein
MNWRKTSWVARVGVCGLGAALLTTVAACGTAARPAPTIDWIVLNQNISIDQLPQAGATATPALPVAMSQAEARTAVPFAFGVPGWAPPGFALRDQVEVAATGGTYASVNLDWEKADGDSINLYVSQAGAAQSYLGAAGSSVAVKVNGQPASLLHTSSLGREQLTLSWTRAALAYRLTAGAGAATAEDLVRMAESIA